MKPLTSAYRRFLRPVLALPLRRPYRLLVGYRKRIKARGKVKYFCLGRNKTGTTSLKKAFEDLGFPVGDQRQAEILYDRHYFNDEFGPIVEYCESAQVFQDYPFSCPETFRHLDPAYPGSKYILTVRNSAEQWYNSLLNFDVKSFGQAGRIPTSDDLKNAPYVRQGWAYNVVKLHGTPDSDPYNKKQLMAHYEAHNQQIIEYFKDRPEDLLVVNLADKSAYREFVAFLGVSSRFSEFPWENKT